MHLGAGVVILVMSVTGAALALKPQILNAVEKNLRFVSPRRDDLRRPVLRPGAWRRIAACAAILPLEDWHRWLV